MLTAEQRHEEPKEATDEYEKGTYVYFDYNIMVSHCPTLPCRSLTNVGQLTTCVGARSIWLVACQVVVWCSRGHVHVGVSHRNAHHCVIIACPLFRKPTFMCALTLCTVP